MLKRDHNPLSRTQSIAIRAMKNRLSSNERNVRYDNNKNNGSRNERKLARARRRYFCRACDGDDDVYDDINSMIATKRRRVIMGYATALLIASTGDESARAREQTMMMQKPEYKGNVKDCEGCSNSNTAMNEGDKEFVQTKSGLRYIVLREGDVDRKPQKGDYVTVDWVGYTAGYQAKKIESTRETDEPYTFQVGSGDAIEAFDEAVRICGKGGIVRVEVAGELEEKLAYSRNTNERYLKGPKPKTFGGQRALDFVLDNKTLKDFNRTLLFDIKVLSVRSL